MTIFIVQKNFYFEIILVLFGSILKLCKKLNILKKNILISKIRNQNNYEKMKRFYIRELNKTRNIFYLFIYKFNFLNNVFII